MTWLELWKNYINIAPGIDQIALRLACAMVVGIFIGLEREYTHRPAGLRTHILVALGACVVSMTGEILFTQYAALGATPDPARLSAQVITGVGFLGAGTIMKEGVNVKGLTTAASVWAVACLGIAAGFGYYGLAILGMVFIFITLTVMEWLQQQLIRLHSNSIAYVLETCDIALSLTRIHDAAQAQKLTITDLSATQLESGHRITFRANYSGRHNKKHHQQFFDAIITAKETRLLQQSDGKQAASV
jgi:putative Mg2+ transporter-C (MgtC) family protein